MEVPAVRTQRTLGLAGTVLLGLSAISLAQNAPIGAEISSVTSRDSSLAAEDMLHRRVESVDWRDKTFEEVLDWLKDQSEGRVNILPKWNVLNNENVTRESLVNLQLNNTTVKEVLDEVLGQLSETDAVTYRGVGNKLTIATRADFDRRMVTKVYDATDLMFRVPDFGQGVPQIDLQKTARSGGSGGGGGGGQGVFSGAGGGSSQEDNESGQQAEQTMRQRMGEIRTLIQNSVAKDSWDRSGQQQQQGVGDPTLAGGGQGRIEIFNRTLIITNTVEIHEMLADRYSLGD
jgi:hypothetical protein